MSAEPTILERILRPREGVDALVFAIGAVMVGAAIRMVAGEFSPTMAPRTIYHPMIMVSTLVGGWPVGVFAAVLSFAISILMLGTDGAMVWSSNAALFIFLSAMIIWLADSWHTRERRCNEIMRHTHGTLGNIAQIAGAALRAPNGEHDQYALHDIKRIATEALPERQDVMEMKRG